MSKMKGIQLSLTIGHDKFFLQPRANPKMLMLHNFPSTRHTDNQWELVYIF